MPTGGSVLYRRLQQVKNRVLRKRRRNLEFEGSQLIDTAMDLQPGARTLIQPQVEEFGQAIVQSPDASDFRLVEVTATEQEFRIFMVGAGYRVTWGEMNAQQFAQGHGQQYNISDIKMEGTQRVIREKVNGLNAFGDASLGVTGALNNGDVTLTDSAFDPFDSNNTSEEIAEWFLGEAGDIAASTNNVEYPTQAGISTELWTLFTSKKMTDTGETILSYILRTQREAAAGNQAAIQNIFRLVECRSTTLEANGAQSGGTNKDRIWLYPKFPEIIEKHMLSGAVRMFPEEWAGQYAGYKIYPMYTCISQVIQNFPGAIRYLDHPKKS
ncbi:MAG: major capsid family protein [Cyanobacteria bacterium J06634_6]